MSKKLVFRNLVSIEDSLRIDREAQSQWDFNPFALVEAAGRSCAQVLKEARPHFFAPQDAQYPDAPSVRIIALAGSGNNGADALVMLRYWLLKGLASPSSVKVILSRSPPEDPMGKAPDTPLWLLVSSLKKMQVPVSLWDDSSNMEAEGGIILDGIAGTGLRGPLEGASARMVEKLNALKQNALVVSVDLPSGLSDEWKLGMPIVKADITLAIEPQKYCLYNPAARPWAGSILPVGGIFPPALLAGCKGPELLDWEYCRNFVPGIRSAVHKYQRGCVEIRAGSPGSAGAALIAARGAQAAGAGLVRLIVDPCIYPIVASQAGSGIMVSPEPDSAGSSRFKPNALLMGPGWGRGEGRSGEIEKALVEEESGTPLILDADGISLSRGLVFHGNTLLTPHTGEFAAYTGLPVEDILSRPLPILLETAAEKKAFILLKSHVMIIVSPEGRWAIVDGMAPNLASGGSGDLLAGFCAALSVRMAREGGLDLFACAAAAAALLVQTGKSEKLAARFTDPMELADHAADLAGRAWLGGKNHE